MRNMYAAVHLNLTAYLEQPTLIKSRHHTHLVLEDSHHTAQRSITCPLAQTVYSGVYALHSGTHGTPHIGYRQVIIIVGMEIKMH